MKKILITGSSGFIGQTILNCSQNKFELVCSHFDICNREEVRKELIDVYPDYIIHLAAQSNVRESIQNPIQTANVNIIGTLNLLECCKELNIKKIVYASSLIKYGDYCGLVNEESVPHPISPYGISKLAVEQFLEYYYNEYGICYLILCLGNVFGEYDQIKNNRIVTSIIHKIINNGILMIYGNGKQTRDFIYGKDLAHIIIDNIDKDTKHKVYNISSGQYSILEIIRRVEAIAGNKVQVIFDNFVRGEMKNIQLDCSLANKELIWRYHTDIDVALRKVYNHFLLTQQIQYD